MTSFDLIVIAVLVLSTAFAVIRGGVREIGTIVALIAAGAFAYLLVRPLQAATGTGDSFIATIVIGAVLAVIGFVLAYWLLHLGLRQVRFGPRALAYDRVGGGAFGFARGLILIGLGFLAYSYYLDEERRPSAVTDAMTLPVAEGMAGLFESLAPASEDLKAPQADDEANEGSGDETTEDEVDAAASGYGRSERTALSEIVTTVTTSDDFGGHERDIAQQNERDPIAALLEESPAE